MGRASIQSRVGMCSIQYELVVANSKAKSYTELYIAKKWIFYGSVLHALDHEITAFVSYVIADNIWFFSIAKVFP